MAERGEPRPVLRVRCSEEDIRQATSLAFRMAQDGEDRYDCMLAVDGILSDRDVSEAVVDYAYAAARLGGLTALTDRARFWTTLSAFVLLVYCLVFAVEGLYAVAVAHPKELLLIVVVVWLQALCIRLAWAALRGTAFELTQHLNAQTFPTVLHPPVDASHEQGLRRTSRMRGLLKDATKRIRAGEAPRQLAGEYARIELTPAASRWLVAQARFYAMVGSTLPPYESRATALILQGGFLAGCFIGLYTLHLRGLDKAPFEYLSMVAGMMTASIGTRPRRRLKS